MQYTHGGPSRLGACALWFRSGLMTGRRTYWRSDVATSCGSQRRVHQFSSSDCIARHSTASPTPYKAALDGRLTTFSQRQKKKSPTKKSDDRISLRQFIFQTGHFSYLVADIVQGGAGLSMRVFLLVLCCLDVNAFHAIFVRLSRSQVTHTSRVLVVFHCSRESHAVVEVWKNAAFRSSVYGHGMTTAVLLLSRENEIVIPRQINTAL